MIHTHFKSQAFTKNRDPLNSYAVTAHSAHESWRLIRSSHDGTNATVALLDRAHAAPVASRSAARAHTHALVRAMRAHAHAVPLPFPLFAWLSAPAHDTPDTCAHLRPTCTSTYTPAHARSFRRPADTAQTAHAARAALRAAPRASRSAFFSAKYFFTMVTMVPFLRVSLLSTLRAGAEKQREGGEERL